MNKKNSLFIATIVLSLTFMGCKSSQPTSVVKLNDETEVTVPCMEYMSDATFFRAQGVGQSKDMNTAREKARMAANAELAGEMNTSLKRLSERYVNDAGQRPSDYAETFESLTRQKVDEQLSNVGLCCNKMTKTADGMYKVYIAVEVDRKKVYESFDRAAADDKKLQTLYDREKFRKVYEAELDSFKKNNCNYSAVVDNTRD
jgi:predicted transcriptional regulator YdeE